MKSSPLASPISNPLSWANILGLFGVCFACAAFLYAGTGWYSGSNPAKAVMLEIVYYLILIALPILLMISVKCLFFKKYGMLNIDNNGVATAFMGMRAPWRVMGPCFPTFMYKKPSIVFFIHKADIPNTFSGLGRAFLTINHLFSKSKYKAILAHWAKYQSLSEGRLTVNSGVGDHPTDLYNLYAELDNSPDYWLIWLPGEIPGEMNLDQLLTLLNGQIASHGGNRSSPFPKPMFSQADKGPTIR
ncbi:hypothetical protein MAIT1_00221 [Magnetofaba australis IT-1]|uniref:Uncharacterized protein n=2 Tax=Magnetofaba TaxID=1472292 RepID=A0A1Y2K8E5_9PROT|nr:hypothetical protein MAIT1_00221 [Magnetofaba australis IT-1]